jgi:hypothetical protein
MRLARTGKCIWKVVVLLVAGIQVFEVHATVFVDPVQPLRIYYLRIACDALAVAALIALGWAADRGFILPPIALRTPDRRAALPLPGSQRHARGGN